MADWHGNAWQPVRPRDDDDPDHPPVDAPPRSLEPLPVEPLSLESLPVDASDVGLRDAPAEDPGDRESAVGPSSAAAPATEILAVPAASSSDAPADQRGPFTSTPIAMPTGPQLESFRPDASEQDAFRPGRLDAGVVATNSPVPMLHSSAGTPVAGVPDEPPVSTPAAAPSEAEPSSDTMVPPAPDTPALTPLPFAVPIRPASSIDSLDSALLIKPSSPGPVSGWRRAIYLSSGRRIDLGNSAVQQRRVDLSARVGRNLTGSYRVAVLSLKGGVGKTTITTTLGSTFASIRGDRIIAVDANPDRGTLGQKVPLETTATVRNLLRDIDRMDRYSDVRAYTSQNVHRLEVLASDADPASSEAFSAHDYDRTLALLERFYSVVLTDCGTGLMHSAMEAILEGADALVVVSSGSVDGARSASATLDWLDAHGYRHLVGSSVAVVNAVRPRSGKVDLARVVRHFEERCSRVCVVPFDPHLEEGAEVDLDRLRSRTRSALLELAAAVAAGFPGATAAPRTAAPRTAAPRTAESTGY